MTMYPIEYIDKLYTLLEEKGLEFNKQELMEHLNNSLYLSKIEKVICGDLKLIILPPATMKSGESVWIDTFFGIQGVGTFKIVRDGYLGNEAVEGMCDGEWLDVGYKGDMFTMSDEDLYDYYLTGRS